MKLGTKLLFAAPIVVVLLIVDAPAAKAWDYEPGNLGGPGGGDYDGIGLGHLLSSFQSGLFGGNGGAEELGCCGGGYNDNPYQLGWDHGIAELVAHYDHSNNLQYNNGGACCHSPAYWSGFQSVRLPMEYRTEHPTDCE